MEFIKRGDDFSFLAKRVRSKKTGTLIPSAALTWRLLTKAGTALGAGSFGAMSQYDVNEADYEGNIPKTFTPSLTKFAKYVLEIIVDNAGIQTTLSIELQAVDVMPNPTPAP
jgi:hypothetical protein